MAYKVTSDTHFFHGNILKFESMNEYRADLYSTEEEMNEGMIEVWNKNVGPSDTVFHGGDFCFGHGRKLEERLESILPRLNGKIVLIRGNHDPRKGDSVFRKYGHEVHEMYTLSVSKQLIVFCHYPLVSWNKSHYGSIMLHGHCHGKYNGPGRILDIGWDVYGKPMDLQEIIDIANGRAIVSVDGH